jgi:hypothetical protein
MNMCIYVYILSFTLGHREFRDSERYHRWLEQLQSRAVSLVARAMRDLLEGAAKGCAEVCMCGYMYVYMGIYTCIYISIHIHMCTYTYIYIYVKYHRGGR